MYQNVVHNVWVIFIFVESYLNILNWYLINLGWQEYLPAFNKQPMIGIFLV